MPPIQTNYAESIGGARAGQISNTELKNLISRTVEDAEGIGFGVAVSYGANDGGITAGTSKLLGVTVRERSVDANSVNLFAQYDTARVMTNGVIWVQNTGGSQVTAGDQVSVITATGLFVTPGTVGSAVYPGAVVETTAQPGEMYRIRITNVEGVPS